MPYAWAVRSGEISVRDREWTILSWNNFTINTSTATMDARREKWLYPANGGGIDLYSLMVEIAWENNHSWRSHRRMIRVMQSGWSVAGSEVTSAVTHGTADDAVPQRHSVSMEPGISGSASIWIEVWQNSGHTVKLKPLGLEAPSFTMVKVGHI